MIAGRAKSEPLTSPAPSPALHVDIFPRSDRVTLRAANLNLPCPLRGYLPCASENRDSS